MEQSGIAQIVIGDTEEQEEITIDQKDHSNFTDVSRNQAVIESTVEKALYIESVKFRDGNKWEFFDAQAD